MDAGWVAVISGGIAMVSSFGTVALTNKSARKRSEREQDAQTERFERQQKVQLSQFERAEQRQRDQFALQLKAQVDQFTKTVNEQRDIEMRKLVYGRRVEVYTHVSETLERVTSSSLQMKQLYEKYWDVMPREVHRELREQIEELGEIQEVLRKAARAAIIIASPALCATIVRCGYDITNITTHLRKHHRELTWRRLDMKKMRNSLSRNHSRCIRLMSADLANTWGAVAPGDPHDGKIAEADLLLEGAQDVPPAVLTDE
ncbi:hypothetical protein [Amycolatopsis sp. Poz14]|uniref:hypothetical protein n=1 Tax=Amycolatopsis sp. Poz14 TaxID=1447705 RepID=UPI001EE7922B|nr:hypothetical protein [Amycolatopsis sp. Poz14]MCG3754676.1 hypothetical protein [Amycolatopsis sp. Poz14]